MAMFKPQNDPVKTYFKPELIARYKAERGEFEIWDREADEKTVHKELQIISICNKTRIASHQEEEVEFESQLVDNVFTETLRLTAIERQEGKKPKYKPFGTASWNSETKSFIHDLTGKPLAFKPSMILAIIGLTEVEATIQVEIKGSVRADLLIVNNEESNIDKVNTVRDSVCINFQAEINTVVAGTKPGKKRNVHLLSPTSVEKQISPELEKKMLGIYKLVNKSSASQDPAREEDLSDVLLEDDDEGFVPKDPQMKTISDAQRVRLFSIAGSPKNSEGFGNPLPRWSNEQIKDYLVSQGYESSKDILAKDYEGICNYLENNPAPEAKSLFGKVKINE